MAESEQLLLVLPFRAADGRDDFLVAPCNAAAVAWAPEMATEVEARVKAS